ncbi:MAG: RsmE family RNA methyltransferase, partial [SAR202 cluster bacterium]|nr:RsmE family RNA methyltransferase [SAR202 cluster bacterium]
MSIHRFWAPVEALVLGGVVELPEAAAHQIRRVLRLRPGNVISVFGGDGVEWKASLAEVGSRVMARLEGGERPDVELPEELELAVAVLKGEKLDWLVQKTTELGVTRIQLL